MNTFGNDIEPTPLLRALYMIGYIPE